jgi:protocatechuate 3,4-dioxygenase beta subunit
MKNNRLISRRGRVSSLAILLLAMFLTYNWQPLNATGANAATVAGCNGTLTPALTEGPYYKAGSPERSSLLETGMSGTKITITGYVYDKNCQPISHAWLDFWQADAAGVYDNSGYRLRGHVYTDASGKYQIETVIPGEYPGRTEHIHVTLQAPGGPMLTTQIFFPGVARNSSDAIFNQALVVNLQDTTTGKIATLDFVLNVTTTPSTGATAVPTAQASTNNYTFKETGFTVSGDFWTAWLNGRSFADSLYINGLPITAVRDEVSPTDGKTYKTQWFERARFEYHPENAAPNNVLFGLLGNVAAQTRQSQTAFKSVSNPGGTTTWFSQTGHTLGNSTAGGQAIAAAWTRMGGLKQFGYPISEVFSEVSKDDGKTYLVQYFERQRFEYHPENNGTTYVVLLGRLGVEQASKTP